MESLVSRLDYMGRSELHRMLTTLQDLLEKTHERITVLKEEQTNPTPLVDASLYELREPGTLDIDCNLLEDVVNFLKKAKFKAHPTNKDSPQILLFGSQHYGFNAQSATLVPIPITPEIIMSKLLEIVNLILGTSYNSMLVNKFKDLNSELVYHKDDERCLDPASPISALSLGNASRRFKISLDSNKSCPVKTLLLKPGSLFTMMPGFQQKYYHALAAGDKNCKAERGVRWSVTFRRLLPPVPAPVATPTLTAVTAPAPTAPVEPVTEVDPIPSSVPVPVTTPVDTQSTSQQNQNTPDTLVFGSSLVKGLNDKMLSKYDKNFKVFANSGACIGDIYEDIERVRDSGSYDITNVTNVFLICGGNDVENIKSDKEIQFVYDDIEDIVFLTKKVFPNAKINIFSLIPRRPKYTTHIRNMHKVNSWLNKFCATNASTRYVDIFSFFLLKTPSMWSLNKKLYNGSRLHFSSIGDSVIAKVLIGVANRPK